MYTIIQNTWCEADDQELLKYIIDENLPYKILSKGQILSLSLTDLSKVEALFVDTLVVQELLKNHNKFINYDTYHQAFNQFYGRSIEKVKYVDLKIEPEHYFVKPSNNDKSFGSMIIQNQYDLNQIKYEDPNVDDVYKCSYVNFVNEYRLFVSNKINYKIAEASDFLISSDKVMRIEPPITFIENVLSVNPFEFVVIDIGLINEGNGSYKWVVVEINPPYALSSYTLPIDDYYNYCKNALKI